MKSDVKPLSYYALAVISLIAPLTAGDSVADTFPTTNEPGIGRQDWFGPPYIQFARKNSDTVLPGYTLGFTSYTHRFTSDFDKLPGDVSSDKFSIWSPIAALNKDKFHIAAWLGYSYTKYDTSVPNLLTTNALQSFSMPIAFFHDISDKWIWGAMVMPSYSGANSSSDNYSISVAAGVGYNHSECLELFAGAYYFNGFGENYVIPGVAFIWRPAPRWEAFILPPIGGISYSINDNWLVSLFGSYESPTWHVEADSDGPDRDITMPSLKLGLKAEYNLHKMLWAYAAAGYSVGQEVSIEDKDNNDLQPLSDIDASPFVEIGLNIRF